MWTLYSMGPNVWGVYNVSQQYRTFAAAVYDNTFTSGTGYFGYAVGIAGHESESSVYVPRTLN
jgi:hypothetical protein